MQATANEAMPCIGPNNGFDSSESKIILTLKNAFIDLMQYLNSNKINNTTLNSIVIVDFDENTPSCI